ncbi:hypothetical protein BDZ89DRAFT_1067653 [Hymenopellis radicata]|nr:hypothetical protein BDZ89DRAFT_1067653 [Hymenopellis radicata]
MDLASVQPFPDLPTDVARSMIEAAAWNDICTAQSLTCVSKIVRQWIDPILHHTVVIQTSSKLEKFRQSIISRNNAVFFARHVKILRIGCYEDGALEDGALEATPLDSAHTLESERESINIVLSACRGLERLALWLPDYNLMVIQDFMGEYGCLSPTHLSVLDVTTMIPSFKLWPSSLTHLHIDEGHHGDTVYIPWRDIFIGYPKLTHICLSGAAVDRDFLSERLLALMKEPLAALPSNVTTFVILLKAGSLPIGMRLRSAIERLAEASDRLVVITSTNATYALVPDLHRLPQDHTLESDWGGDGRGMDTWEFADLCIAERERKRRCSSEERGAL